MDFCIDSKLLGTPKHLLVTSFGFTWLNTVPRTAWHLDGTIKLNSERCLDSLIALGGSKIDIFPPEKYRNAILPFTSGSNQTLDLPWQMLMPSAAHRSFVKNIVEQVSGIIQTLPVEYYEKTWSPGNVAVCSLQRASVDPVRYRALIDLGEGNIPAIKSFRPARDGYAQPVVYNRLGTLTGRLTVKAGPQILTLKREHRDMIVSSTGGSIVSIDFAALEARVLLYEAGRRCEDKDLYAMIANELGGNVTRKAAKAAVISELYGSSKWALGNVLGIEGQQLNDFIKKVKAYFNTHALLERIKEQFVKTGYITNRYGRKVLIDEPQDNIMVNYYAQSSGVDVSLLGFSQIVETLKTTEPGVRPIFLLHDALLLDVPRESLSRVLSFQSVHVPGYVQSFPVKAEIISCTK